MRRSARSSAGSASRPRKGVNVFTGFPAARSSSKDGRSWACHGAVGARSQRPAGALSGGDRYQAKVTVLTEGTRGLLSQAYLKWQGIARRTRRSSRSASRRSGRRSGRSIASSTRWAGRFRTTRSAAASCIRWRRTWSRSVLVVGLDYHARLDVHVLAATDEVPSPLHAVPEGGQLVEWGAKTIPKAASTRCRTGSGDGLLMVGDAAGFVDVPSLKGIHYAMHSGIFAARAGSRRQGGRHLGAAAFSDYDRMVDGALSRAICIARATCGWRSRTGCTWAGSRQAMTADRRAASRGADRDEGRSTSRGRRPRRRDVEPPSRLRPGQRV